MENLNHATSFQNYDINFWNQRQRTGSQTSVPSERRIDCSHESPCTGLPGCYRMPLAVPRVGGVTSQPMQSFRDKGATGGYEYNAR